MSLSTHRTKPQSLWHSSHCSTLTAVQNFPQGQLMLEPGRLNPKSFKFLMFSPSQSETTTKQFTWTTSARLPTGKHSLHKYSSWNYCPRNIQAYALNCMLTLSDNNCLLHPASPSAPISRKLTLNLALNCGRSHTIQHTHFCLRKSFLPSPLPCGALLTVPPRSHDQTAVGYHQRDHGKSRETAAGEGGEQRLWVFL